jgi:hypothetical protein
MANRAVGWICMAVGIAGGLVLGLWSFDGPAPVPDWIGDYASTSRRMIRLAHIALMALGIINILLARELPDLVLGPGTRHAVSLTMNIGNVFLPATLVAGALYTPLKYLMAVPALCVFYAIGTMAYASLTRRQDDAR